MASSIAVSVPIKPLSHSINGLKHKSSDADNLDMPKRSHNVLHLSEKVRVFLQERERKKSFAEVGRLYTNKETW